MIIGKCDVITFQEFNEHADLPDPREGEFEDMGHKSQDNHGITIYISLFGYNI